MYDLFLLNYREYTYEKGYANAFIHSHPAWKDSAKDPAAKGGWVDVYTNTPGAAGEVCKEEMRLFKDRFLTGTIQDVLDSTTKVWRRPYEFLVAKSLRERVWQNWVVPKVRSESSFSSSAFDEALRRHRDGHFDEELDNLVAIRGDVRAYNTATMEAYLPGLTRALQGLAARAGDTEIRALEEKDLIARWEAVAANMDKDEEAFEVAVERESGPRRRLASAKRLSGTPKKPKKAKSR